jgi:hypothetical protein
MDEEWQPLSSSWHKTKPIAQLKKQARSDAEDNLLPVKMNNSVESRLAAAPAGRLKTAGDHMVATIEEKVGSSGRHPPQPVYSQNRLSSLLFKHKEQLKKEIARKRNLLEKELAQDINREVDSLKQQAALKLGAEAANFNAGSRKRRTQESSSALVGVQPQATSSAVTATPPSQLKSTTTTNQVNLFACLDQRDLDKLVS